MKRWGVYFFLFLCILSLPFLIFLGPLPLPFLSMLLPFLFPFPSFLSVFSPETLTQSEILNSAHSFMFLFQMPFSCLLHLKCYCISRPQWRLLFETILEPLNQSKQNCRFPSWGLCNLCFCYCINDFMAIIYLFGGLSFLAMIIEKY